MSRTSTPNISVAHRAAHPERENGRGRFRTRLLAVALGLALTGSASPLLATPAQAQPTPAAPTVTLHGDSEADLSAAAAKKKYKIGRTRQKEIRTNQKILTYAFSRTTMTFNYKKAKKVDQKYFHGKRMLPALAWGIWRSNHYNKKKVSHASKADWAKIKKLDDAARQRVLAAAAGPDLGAQVTCTGSQGHYATKWRIVYRIDSCAVDDLVFYGSVCAGVAGFATVAIGDPRGAVWPGLVALECGLGAAKIAREAGKSDVGAVDISWWITAALRLNTVVFVPGAVLVWTAKPQ